MCTAEGVLYLVWILYNNLNLVIIRDEEAHASLKLTPCNAPTKARTHLHPIFTKRYL